MISIKTSINMSSIVVLDGFTLNPGDLSGKKLEQLGQVASYDRPPPELFADRAAQAEILVVNKHKIGASEMDALSGLKLIAVSATGYNNVDTQAAQERGIRVVNVSGYSTPAVVQHVFALLLGLINKVEAHDASVKTGGWSAQQDFSYTLSTIAEISTLKLGIYGFGRIGQAVAQVGLAFGMEVLSHHKHPQRDATPGVTFVSLEELFRQSNVVSLHAPLNDSNRGIVNKDLLELMPTPAYLINTGRGGLINEMDVLQALKNGKLSGAGLDVLSQEPPPVDHPLLRAPNCLITPHVAWATQAARQRLLDEVIQNIEAFRRGEDRNVVV